MTRAQVYAVGAVTFALLAISADGWGVHLDRLGALLFLVLASVESRRA